MITALVGDSHVDSHFRAPRVTQRLIITDMQRLTRPVWHGASALMLAIGVLVLAGLAVQLAQGWVSVAGDWIWSLAFALVSIVAVTDRGRSRTPAGRLSTASFVLLGLGAAALMVEWALVDAAQADRPSVFFTGMLVALAVVAVLSRFLADREVRGAKRSSRK